MTTKRPPLTPELRREMKAFINDPNRWPLWPGLPVKRHVEGEMETAYVLGDPNPPLHVYSGNVMAPSNDDPIIGTYDTVDALLDDGWEVD